ncbi:MAG: hypothetical protein EON93_05145 [Burkholderiales bacterium]|nr:MAG: hypothetical protein EON93_05145 [Burkholderiales bacterium]
MRVFVIAAAVLLAAPAWAQPVVDGKASVDEHVGSTVESYLENMKYPEGGVSSFRSIISYVVSRGGMTPEERDLFVELASGSPVEVTAPGKTFRVPALTGRPLAIAKLFTAPPNLNTLWKQQYEPALTLVEMSRWGAPAKNRITDFMANKLYAAWIPSRVSNSYSEWVSEFAGANNALISIDDGRERKEMTLLLKAAMEKLFAKAKADGREPPAPFLYHFMFVEVGDPAPAP